MDILIYSLIGASIALSLWVIWRNLRKNEEVFHMSTLEKVNEACRLRAFMPGNREFVVSMADIFGCRPLKADGDALYHFLETIYNYGRVEGIRQERKRNKEVIT